MNKKLIPSESLSEVWQEFTQAQFKSGSKLGKHFEKSAFGSYEQAVLTLYFSDEDSAKVAKGLNNALKEKLPRVFQLCTRVNYKVGDVRQPVIATSKKIITTPVNFSNPLQVLNRHSFGQSDKGEELPQPILTEAVKAEKTCDAIYQKLQKRTEMLATDTLSASFDWRLRIGGVRGFRELLLPVFHPVFGVPYLPAASLKGAARAWAGQNSKLPSEISDILGILDGKIAKVAKVEFLDAFPTKACLSVDVATPQWHWQNDLTVKYDPQPHYLLSMEQPTFLIGLIATKPENEKHVVVVKEWLEHALESGIGSRVSGGYGRASSQAKSVNCVCSYDFELWTQGMYGGNQQNPEFRPTAIRGILRYWFRAVALGLYSVEKAKVLEIELFGDLSKQGKFSINVKFAPKSVDDKKYTGKAYTGKISLEIVKSKLTETIDSKYLNILSKLLLLAVHLGGVGRGSRRPLHLLHDRMRGCHWTISDRSLPLKLDLAEWQGFFQELRSAFSAVQLPDGNLNSDPGEVKNRYQDTLDNNAQVWLLSSVNQIAPETVTDWQKNGNTQLVLGSALSLLYADTKFKGENQKGVGNQNVGGKLGTPSFVWIKSIFPYEKEPYQVVTIFGADHPERLEFAKALKKNGATLVFGKMHPSSLPV
jgi:CRISPR-associated protein Cmr6